MHIVICEKKMAETKPILIHFSTNDLKKIDKLVKDGFYASRTEAVRDAVRKMLTEFSDDKRVMHKIAEDEVDKAIREWIEEDPRDRLKKLGLG